MLTVTRRRIVYALVLCDLLLIGLSLLPLPSGTARRWFDLGSESNIPTWFSSLQLLLLALLAWTRSTALPAREDSPLRRLYLLAAAGFLLFSVDETAMIHEGLTSISKKMGVLSPLPDAHGAWIFLYGGAAIVLLLASARGVVAFLREKSGTPAFLAGAGLFVLGGVVVETCGYFGLISGVCSALPLGQVTIEESLELTGQTVMIYGLLAKNGTIEARLGTAAARG